MHRLAFSVTEIDPRTIPPRPLPLKGEAGRGSGPITLREAKETRAWIA